MLIKSRTGPSISDPCEGGVKSCEIEVEGEKCVELNVACAARCAPRAEAA